MKIVYSPKCLKYSQSGHPESPARIANSYARLRETYEFVAPNEILDEEILRVHSKSLFDAVKTGRFVDADSPAYPDIHAYATLSAAAAVTACRLSLGGETALSLMRPPGHHAGKDFLGGFCYFNNVAIAVASALREVKRVAILDFDCHHGNGTQNIFLGRDDVLYVSLHQSPLYPGTGLRSERNCLNHPLPAGTDEAAYMETLVQAINSVKAFSPDLIAVSAGFDTYRGDPLAGLQLEITSYEKIGRMINELRKPTLAVLEGGYARDLPECIDSFLRGLR
ncbi:MAG TPA: hypothetical protein VN285_05180 [Candidatus Deferrimicrobium sp.]|nr:hypothetical protein [Candidatus Deferrimicrobium sp.]